MYKFNVYPDGEGYNVDLTYTLPDRTLAEVKKAYFSWNRTNALMYAHRHFASWLNDQFKKYVTHAIILSETGETGFYCTKSKLDSIARLKDYKLVSSSDSIHGLVLQIILLEQDMRNVLPSAKNNSYQTSHDRLEDIVEQCRRYRKLFIKNS